MVNDKDKRKAILKMNNGKALLKLSRSLVAILPKTWVDLYAWEVDNTAWLSMEVTGDTITLKPLDKEYILNMMRKNNVSPQP